MLQEIYPCILWKVILSWLSKISHVEIVVLVLQNSSNSNNIQFFQLPLSLRSIALTPSGRICIMKFMIACFLIRIMKLTCLVCNFSRRPAPFLPTVYFFLSNEYAGFCWKSLSYCWIGRVAKVFYLIQCKYSVVVQKLLRYLCFVFSCETLLQFSQKKKY